MCVFAQVQVCVIIDKACAWESPSCKSLRFLVKKSDPGGFPGEVTQSSCQLEGGRWREDGEGRREEGGR